MAEKLNFELDVNKIIAAKLPRLYSKIPPFIIRYLKKILHQDELNEIIRLNRNNRGVDFMRGVVNYFGLNFELFGLDELPMDKTMIFASNHPLGGLDGICLSTVIGEHYNHKIKYLVNDLLLNIDNLKEIFIPINKYGRQSRESSKLITEAFLSDNQIITFPAGLCSRKTKGEICDLDWGKMLIQKSIEFQRDVVPVYFDGRNSNFFYRLANIRKALGIKFNYEMLYLSDEMFKNRGKTFQIYFGKPIPWQTFGNSKSPKEWAEFVKGVSSNLKK